MRTKLRAQIKYFSALYKCFVCEFMDDKVRCFGHFPGEKGEYSPGQEVEVIKGEISKSSDGRWILSAVPKD